MMMLAETASHGYHGTFVSESALNKIQIMLLRGTLLNKKIVLRHNACVFCNENSAEQGSIAAMLEVFRLGLMTAANGLLPKIYF